VQRLKDPWAAPDVLIQTRFSFRFPQRFRRAAIKFLSGVYEEAPELGSHSYAAIRISLRSGILKRPQPRRRCVSSRDVLDLLGCVLVAVFERRLAPMPSEFPYRPKTIEQPNEQMEHV
jgi:hypothetical protein